MSLACVLAAMTVVVPLHAGAGSETVTIPGRIEATATSPNIPRMLYLAHEGLNGTVGFVTPVSPSNVERPFSLQTVSSGFGPVDADVWFYKSISGTGHVCGRDAVASPGGGETGTMCPDAQWAVVVLFAGGQVDFTLSFPA